MSIRYESDDDYSSESDNDNDINDNNVDDISDNDDVDEGKPQVIIEEDDEEGVPVFIPKTTYAPMKHQADALLWMAKREKDDEISGGILGLEMGLGKTFTSLLHVCNTMNNIGDRYPTLIVCPKTAIYTWVNEIKKFFGNTMSVLIFRKDNQKIKSITKEDLKYYNVVITNYEYLRSTCNSNKLYNKVGMKDINGRCFGANIPHKPVVKDYTKYGIDSLLFAVRWNRIIADESHNFSNYKTTLWQAMMCLCAKYRWCLSGSPIRNYGDDLYAQYKFLGYYEPEFDIKNFYDLNLKKYIYYMDYATAGVKLSHASHIKVPCKIDREQEKIYNIYLTQTKKEFNNFTAGTSTFVAVFTLFLRLRQICIAPYSLTPDSDKNLLKKKKIDMDAYEKAQAKIDVLTGGLSSWLRDKNSTSGLNSSKIVETMKIISTVKKGEKIVVFTMFKRVIDLLKEKMDLQEGCKKNYVAIDGTVTGDKRDRCLDAFKNDGDIDVLFVSYKIGAESLNLTEAQHVILMEPWYSPAILDQAKARVHRIGQNKPVYIYELYIPNTDTVKSIEEAIMEICHNKRNIASEYLNEGKSKKGGKLDAKTMGEILNAYRGVDSKGKK